MATCTMAKVRSLGLLPTSLATRALAVTFQSVMTSAPAGATQSAAATMPSSNTAAGMLGIAFMVGLLLSLCLWHRALEYLEIFPDHLPSSPGHNVDRICHGDG